MDVTWEKPDWVLELEQLPREQEMYPPLEGFTVGDQLRWVTPPEAPPGCVFEPEVVYGSAGRGGRDLRLHLYRPSEGGVRHPAVLFVHGGGWIGGHRLMHVHHAALMASLGFVAATCEYRLSPEAPWPAGLEDVKCAVRWLTSRPDVDPSRIGISGASAGGHLAAMVALTPDRFEGSGGSPDAPSSVAAAVLLYPATDLEYPYSDPHLLELRDAFLAGENPSVASPLRHVGPKCPPVLTITGSEDHLTVLPTIEPFHERLDDMGVVNELVVYEGAGHGFDQYPAYRDEVLKRTAGWFERHLEP